MEASTSRKITVNLYMTLDGYGEFPKYPGSDVVPREPGDAWKEMWSNRYVTVDTVIFGRRSFEGHQNVHSEAARKPETLPIYSNSHGGSTAARRFSFPIL